MSQPAHLSDERLAECFFNERCGESPDLALLEHLADCPSCGERYERVSTMLSDIREVADAETDAEFTPELLARQQQQILTRLEGVNRPARVLSFPAPEKPVEPREATRLTTRWIAGAAAAGLFIGFAVGGYVGPEPARSSAAATPPMSVQRAANQPAVMVGATVSDTTDDEQFLQELDLALTRSYARELQPFDALTPHVRE
jgi:anti-sigma factor RsiW